MQSANARSSRTAVLGYLPVSNKSSGESSTVLGSMGSSGAANGDGYVHDAAPAREGPPKRTLPANGKKTKGRVKIKMEFIDNKLRRYTTFSKRKTGIMKKAYELSTLTGTQVMLLVASETGHVYTFATRKLQPMITSEAGKALIQTCLNSPDPPPGPGSSGLDQRMSATGFEETDLTYSVGDDCDKAMDMQDDCKGYSSSPDLSLSGDGSPINRAISRSSPPMLTFTTAVVDGKTTTVCPPSNVQLQHHLPSRTTSGNSGFTAVLKAATGGTLTPTVQIGRFHPSDVESAISNSGPVGSSSPLYRMAAQANSQPFSIAMSGSTKNDTIVPSSSTASAQNAISLVQNTPQNLSVVSGNVVIPAGQTLLQAANNTGTANMPSAFMYQTAQGLVYATPTPLPEGGLIFNIGQEQGGSAHQQYITIPVSLSLTPSQQQLLHVSTAPVSTTCQVTTGGGQTKRGKSRK